MKKLAAAFLNLSLLFALTLYASGSNLTTVQPGQAQTRASISDEASAKLFGGDDPNKKFLNGVACGLGLVAIAAGFAGGAFTGGLTTAITLTTLLGSTVSACGEAI